MIKPGRPVKDIEIKKDTSIDKIFNEMSQSGGFESTSLSAGLEILTEMISDKLNQKLEKEVVKNVFFIVGNLESEISSSNKAEISSALDQPSIEPKLNKGRPGSTALDSIDLDSIKEGAMEDL